MAAPRTQEAGGKCIQPMHDGSLCGRETYDDQGRCICHSEKPDKNAMAFEREIEAMLARKHYDFTGFVFPDGLGFSRHTFEGPVWLDRAMFQGSVSFEAATFQGSASFEEATFHGGASSEGATFGGEAFLDEMLYHRAATFEGATFQAAATFWLATFSGNAIFWRTTFQGGADFGGTTFQGAAGFSSARFQGGASLFGARFEGRAFFHHARFQGDANFGGTRFQGDAGFFLARFQGDANFGGTRFQREARFVGTTFQGQAAFRGSTFAGQASFEGYEDQWVFSRKAEADLKGASFHQPEVAVFQHVFLGCARFLGADVRRVDFTDVEWASRPLWGPRWQRLMARGGRLSRPMAWVCARWPARLKPRGRFALWDELGPEEKGQEKDYALIGKLYRQLKHNYEEQRDPITAGDFHFGEMHMRRLSHAPKNGLLRFLKRNLSFLALYRWISGYGEDYLLPLAWIGGVLGVFGAAFVFIPPLALQANPSAGTPQPVPCFWQGLLHSTMCLLLRSDKPFRPVHLAGQYLSVAEGIIGASLIAMFVLALNRRFKR